MFKQKKKTAIGSALIALCMTASFAIPASAAPQRILLPNLAEAAGPKPVQVDHRRDHHRPNGHRGYYRQNGHHYYNGHRGYRERRRGYQEYNGWWFPPAAFALGAVIGSQAVTPQQALPPKQYREMRREMAPRGRGLGPDHYRWCSNRYRSYDPRSNTFQPYNGPRQACRSPFY
ncbi:BA14K family protein [Roseibium suaedae]|uniref:Lectin-like protein BA14k n=1 Tax=Roseibium suaedae TaxID=735517 RepID=A0A1M7G9A2_9HYPH|nr:BA14K family protein [Roseibium suaedae]SHM12873.1 BA14K-like protein [Roseibium suaedae]